MSRNTTTVEQAKLCAQMLEDLSAMTYKKSKPTDTEDSVETFLVNTVNKLRGRTRKLGDNAWPDRLVMLPTGIMFFVELKRPSGGSFEPGERETLIALNHLGARAYVARTRESVHSILVGELTLQYVTQLMVMK